MLNTAFRAIVERRWPWGIALVALCVNKVPASWGRKEIAIKSSAGYHKTASMCLV